MARSPQTERSIFITLLGGFHIAGRRCDEALDLERRKTRALLAILALDCGRMVPRGSLTALLWGDRSEPAARHALRQCLLDLRHALGREFISVVRARDDLIGLDPVCTVVDVADFERCAGQGTPAALTEAAALYHGDFLEGFALDEPAFEEWLRFERERLRARAVEVLRKLLAHEMRGSATSTALQISLRLLALEPFDETVHRTLMRLYTSIGQRGAAMRQYEECVHVLGRELGVEPERETRELYRQLLAAQPGPAGAARPGSRHAEPTPPPARRAGFPVARDAPLVGRVRDLQWLDDLRRRAQQGEPQLALVIGDAGIGKSRLVSELAVRAQHARNEVFLGRGREGEDVLAFAPWTEAMRPALSRTLLTRLPPVTRRDLSRLLPEIGDGRADSSGGLEDGPRLFEAVAQALRWAAARRPLVVVIEDLHWCDDMTLRLLRFLPRRLHGQPVLLLGTARREELVGGSSRAGLLDVLRVDPSCSSRMLDPLSPADTRDLFQALLPSGTGQPTAALVERVWTLSEGNPFVVLECARAVRARGVADSSLALPERVHELTTHYLAALGSEASRLADLAAVIGRDFEADVLRQAADLTETAFVAHVEELVRRRVLREAHGRFDVCHDRVREVAYARVLGPRREHLHHRVARALEALYTGDLDPYLAAIGLHYSKARLWAEASEYQARAGFLALSRGASREALACFEGSLEALGRLPHTEERGQLGVRVRLAVHGALLASASYEGGRTYLHEAERLAGMLADRRWAGRVACALSNSYRLGGGFDRALDLGKTALAIAGATDDPALESSARYTLGQVELGIGNFRRSLEYLLPVADGEPLPPGQSGLSFTHGAPLWTPPSAPWRVGRPEARYWSVFNQVLLGEFDSALGVIDGWLREVDADAQIDPLGTQRVLAGICLGKLHNETGDGEAAVRAFEAALGAYEEEYHGNRHVPLAWGLGLAYARAGRFRESADVLTAAEESIQRKSPNTLRPLRLYHRAAALMQSGQVVEAGRVAEEMLRLVREKRLPEQEGLSRWILAEVARLGNPLDRVEMEQQLLTALALAERLERRPQAARCHLRLAWLYKDVDHLRRERHVAAATLLLAQMGGHLKLDSTDREIL